MKINVAFVDQTTPAVIRETIGDVYEFASDNTTSGLTLAEISGILRMAEAMKEVLEEQ